MPGRQSGDNKFGLTPFIVGQTLGDGCNYSSIQTAIDDCFAAGGGVVGIRFSTTNYVENLTLRAGVDLYGFCVDGRLPSIIGQIVIEGNHTYTQVGGFGACIAQYITFLAPAGDAFTIVSTGGGSAIIAMKFCGIEAQTVAGQRAFVMNSDITSSCQFSTDNTNIGSDSHCFDVIGPGGGGAFISLGSVSSANGDILNVSGGGSGSLSGQHTQVSAGLSALNSVTGNGSSSFSYSDIFTSSEAFLFGAAGGSVQVSHCSIASGAVSGNWVDGPTGSVIFGDILLNFSALNIGAGITQGKQNWQPYAETAAVALASNRGTASFENIAFQVTDGFVSLANSTTGAVTSLTGDTGTAFPSGGTISIVGGPGVTTSGSGNTITIASVIWSNAGGPVTVLPDSGTFDVVGTTITLPAAPVQGEECRFVSVATPTVIQAVGAQTIQIGTAISSVAGTCTGANVGDSVVLVYFAAFDRWYSVATNGNWVLA